MDAQEIGKFIEERRQQLKLNQQDVAEMAGVTAKTIYLIETGTGNPSLRTLDRLLTVLGLSMRISIREVES